MSQLLKREFLKNWPIAITLLAMIPFFTLLQINDKFSFIYPLLVLILFSWNTDKEHRFLISLPVKKRHIVLSHYVFIVIVCSGLLLCHLLVNLTSLLNSEMALLPFLILFSFCLMIGYIAFMLPLFYYFKSIWIAFFLQLVCMIMAAGLFGIWMGFDLFHNFTGKLLNFIFMEPFSVLPVLSGVVLFLSYILSCWIFSRKDFA